VDHLFGAEIQPGLGVANLSVVQQLPWNGPDVIQRGGGPAKVQRIHQNAGVGRHARTLHNAQRRLGIFDGSPGHELQIGTHAIRLHHFAQAGVVVGQTGLIGVITGHQNGSGFERGTFVVKGIPGVGVKQFADADDLQVEHVHTRVALRRQGFAQSRRLAEQMLLWGAHSVGPQAQAHKVVAGLGSNADRLRWRAAV